MRKPATVLIIGTLLLLHSWAWIALRGQIPELEQENGWMENYQAIGLLICVGIWVAGVVRSKAAADRIFLASLALFSASLLVLEVDFRRLNAPLLNRIMNGRIRDIWLGTLWLGAAFLFFKNRQAVFISFVRWIRTFSGTMMLLGGMFWVLAAMIDKGVFGTKTLFREELMEVNAALCMVASGFAAIISRRAGACAARENKEKISSSAL